jgi:hypothetical protein
MKNQPYISNGKKLQSNYLHAFPNRKQRRTKEKRAFYNGNAFPIIVTRIGATKFVKWHKKLQKIDNKIIVHYIQK